MPLPGRLENRHYIKLADAISTVNMETIVQRYLDLDSNNAGPDQIKVRDMRIYRKG